MFGRGVFFVYLLCAATAFAETRVIDGDTFVVDGTTVRLLDIDAPETGQICLDGQGRETRCGDAASNALREILSRGAVHCIGSEQDSYGRLLARCSVGGADVSASLVLAGHALAFRRYSDRYVPEENAARKVGVGLWAGRFEAPWDYRAARWRAATESAPRSGCPIKGNINSDGERIYHTPYSRSYAATRINEARGERWFCDEAEAIAAGWRAPLW